MPAMMPVKYLIVASFLLILCCWNAVGFLQGDEHFQILEFAAYKQGIVAAADLPWEFAERMRPAAQPAIAWSAYSLFELFGTPHPYWLAFFLRLLSAGLFTVLAVCLFRRYSPQLSSDRLIKWFALLLLFNWASIYSGIRFSGENWSGVALAAGFLLYPMAPPKNTEHYFTPGKKAGPSIFAFYAGLLFGLSFLFRYQMGLMVVGFGAWLLFLAREKWQRVGLIILGGLTTLAIGTLLDYWLYGEWVIAPWHYLEQNLVAGKAAEFGTLPWYGYFQKVFERGVPPLSLIYLGASLWFLWRYRRDPISWMIIPFFVVHCFLSRKDVRFLFPLLPFLPVMIIAAAQELQKAYGAHFFDRKWVRGTIGLCVLLNGLLLASIALRPATTEVLVNRYIYNHYDEPITLFADGKHAFSYANLIIRFYQRPGGVRIINGERSNWPACQTAHCLYSEQTKTPNPPPGAKQVYTNRPAWAEPFNFGGWLDGMRWWYIYELE